MMIAVNYSIVTRCSRCILQAEASAACNSIVFQSKSNANSTALSTNHGSHEVVREG